MSRTMRTFTFRSSAGNTLSSCRRYVTRALMSSVWDRRLMQGNLAATLTAVAVAARKQLQPLAALNFDLTIVKAKRFPLPFGMLTDQTSRQRLTQSLHAP